MPAQVKISASNGTQELRSVNEANRLLIPGGPITSKVFSVGQEPAWLQAFGLIEDDQIIVEMVSGSPQSPVIATFRPAGGKVFRLSTKLNSAPILYPGRYRLRRAVGSAAATVYGFAGTVSHEISDYYSNNGDAEDGAELYLGSGAYTGYSSPTTIEWSGVRRNTTTGTFTPPFEDFSLPWVISGVPGTAFAEIEIFGFAGGSFSEGAVSITIAQNGIVLPNRSTQTYIPANSLATQVELKARIYSSIPSDVYHVSFSGISTSPDISVFEMSAKLIGG